MRTIALTLIAFLIAGCQTGMRALAGGPPLGTPKCLPSDNTDDCKILVSVSVVDGRCTVNVASGQMIVGVKRGVGDKWLWWKIDGAPPGEWTFTRNGIAPKAKTTDWSDNFKNDKLSDDGTAFRWKNRNNEPGREYEYEINLINAAGQTCKLDPIIKNQA